MKAEHLMLIGGVAAFLLTLYWVRRRTLREKYALFWMVLAAVLLVVGIFPEILKSFAEWAHLSFPAAVLFFALSAAYLFAFSISISLSRLYQRNVRLTQEMALLEERLRGLEKERQDVHTTDTAYSKISGDKK